MTGSHFAAEANLLRVCEFLPKGADNIRSFRSQRDVLPRRNSSLLSQAPPSKEAQGLCTD